MRKVALLTPFDTGNIGTVLQAYATQTLIREHGYNCDLLHYHYDSIQNPFLFSNLIKRGLIKYVSSIAGYLMRLSAKKALWEFIDKHLCLTEKLGYSDLKNATENYDLVLVGSDCVWNGEAFSLDTAYQLDFLREDSKKVNYASSFACNDIPDEQKPIFARNLSKFNSLSVRELRGQEIIKELTGKEATLVLDPTLVKDSLFWTNIADESSLCLDENYIFVAEYAISSALLNDAQKLSEKYGLPIYCLYPPKGKHIHAKVFMQASPQDVLKLIQKASFVLTDSYHMMIFSINFGKDFFAYQTNINLPAISKYYSILSILNINERLFKTENILVNDVDIRSLKPMNYERINLLLEQEREKSLAYLKRILN